MNKEIIKKTAEINNQLVTQTKMLKHHQNAVLILQEEINQTKKQLQEIIDKEGK